LARDPRSDERPVRSAEAGPGEESFLGRWSRLKRHDEPAVRAEPPPAPVRAVEPEPAQAPRELTDEDMPDLGTIGEGSDVSPFFSPRVSEELRQAALKRLFRSPRFNIRDGLDDYDEDFRSFHALGDIVTAEMRLQRERAEARLRRELAESGESTGDPAADADASAATHAHHEADDDDGQHSDGPERA
jgi:hypothetical protein